MEYPKSNLAIEKYVIDNGWVMTCGDMERFGLDNHGRTFKKDGYFPLEIGLEKLDRGSAVRHIGNHITERKGKKIHFTNIPISLPNDNECAGWIESKLKL